MIELCDRYTCTGCSSCYNACRKNAITMVDDEEGFLVPSIDTSLCVECGACVSSCPLLSQTKRSNEGTEPIVYAGYIKDEQIRQRSSSGGMFTAIATSFFEQNKKSKKYLVAAQFNKHLELNHVIVDSIEQISKMRCSKYVQSKIDDIYNRVKELLKANSSVMFVGTPCQVAGLYSFLGNKQYDHLLTVDLICHGVPSPKLFSSYLKKIGIKEDKEYFDYLFRDTASTGFFTSSYISKKRKRHKVPINQHSYIMAYLKGWLHRECCYNCHFNGIPRQADITIGDFWGVISGKVPFNGARGKGISVLLANTDKGKQMATDLSSLCYFEIKTIEEAIVDNHNLVEADKRPDVRNTVYLELNNMSPEDFMKKYDLHLPYLSKKEALRQLMSRAYHAIIRRIANN